MTKRWMVGAAALVVAACGGPTETSVAGTAAVAETVALDSPSIATEVSVDQSSTDQTDTAVAAKESGFGQVAPLDDRTIFYLPDPMPTGWHVAGAVQGVFPDEGSTGDLEAVPPVEDGTFHDYLVWLIKDDGTALATLSVTEYPAAGDMANILYPGTEPVDVGGVARAHFGTFESHPTGVPGVDSFDNWSWIQDDGRKFGFGLAGPSDDLNTFLTSIRRVTGAELSAAIADGQNVAMRMPVIEAAVLANGASVTTRGRDSIVLAVCAQAAVSTCGYVGIDYDLPSAPRTAAATGDAAFNVAWLPASVLRSLVPGPTLISVGETGAFATDFSVLGLGSVQNSQVVPGPRPDLLGMPDLTN